MPNRPDRVISSRCARWPAALLAAAALTVGAPALASGDDKHQHAAAHDHAEPDITQYVPDYKLPELWFGDKAPELRIAEFVKGEPVTSFEPGRVYVVEFWATWCGPCIRAFPHLSKLQKEHGDKMTIIGVNIWDNPEGESQDARIERVNAFVESQGERMDYTVAVEQDDTMAESWMTQAGRRGIPAAFIVDQKGHIAWMGHPAGMDEPLKQVMAGKYDSAEAAKKAKKQHKLDAWTQVSMTKIVEGADDAYPLASKLIPTVFADEPMLLNQMSWFILTSDRVPERDVKVAYQAARLACEKTDWEEPSILDTYALAAFENGKVEKAVEMQRKAIKLLPGTQWENSADEFKKALKRYEAELAEG